MADYASGTPAAVQIIGTPGLVERQSVAQDLSGGVDDNLTPLQTDASGRLRTVATLVADITNTSASPASAAGTADAKVADLLRALLYEAVQTRLMLANVLQSPDYVPPL